MPRLSSKLRDLLNAEVFQWEPGEIVWQASERQGPVEVWYRGVLVASYPFWAHWRLDGRTGALYLFDPRRGEQVEISRPTVQAPVRPERVARHQYAAVPDFHGSLSLRCLPDDLAGLPLENLGIEQVA